MLDGEVNSVLLYDTDIVTVKLRLLGSKSLMASRLSVRCLPMSIRTCSLVLDVANTLLPRSLHRQQYQGGCISQFHPVTQHKTINLQEGRALCF